MVDGEKNIVNNIEILSDEIGIVVSVNPKIYSTHIIFSAAYIFIDIAYVVVTGDPEKEILVALKPKKEDTDLEEMGRDFNNELLNYAVYYHQSEVNKDIKNAIIQKTLFPNNIIQETSEVCNCPECVAAREEESNFCDVPEEDDTFDLNYEDDPLGISKPWSEEESDK